MASIGISDVVSVSVYSEKTRMKKLMMMKMIIIITPHAQCERGKVIDHGVHIYVCGRKKYLNRTLEIDSPFQIAIRSRTSCRIYRLALPLRAPETLSSLSKSRISIFNAHLTLFVRRMTSHNSIGGGIGKYRNLVN